MEGKLDNVQGPLIVMQALKEAFCNGHKQHLARDSLALSLVGPASLLEMHREVLMQMEWV